MRREHCPGTTVIYGLHQPTNQCRAAPDTDLRKETSVLLSSLLFKAPRSRRTRKVWNGHVSPSSSLDTHQPDQGTLCHVV
uniref:Uncharacterized protein n=1 Tax=Triticum urartu TaxID=4572 RepID=A0A8R7UFN5_TRIUA